MNIGPEWLPGPGRPRPPTGQNESALWMNAELFARRVVLVSGVLDDAAAGEIAVQLMTLDASGDDHITLQVNASGTNLQAAFTVMDTIDLLGVPVHALCVGRAEGPAVGVIAIAHQRRAAPHASFRLSPPRFESAGTASEVAEWSLHCQRQFDRFCDRLAAATGQSSGRIADDLEASRTLSAREAVRYGLIDTIGHGGGHQPPRSRPFGFQVPPADL